MKTKTKGNIIKCKWQSVTYTLDFTENNLRGSRQRFDSSTHHKSKMNI